MSAQFIEAGAEAPREPSKYDPRYDPLVAMPGTGQDYAPADHGPVTTDLDADVVIIGSGFTGLCTAIYLAQDHGIKATILEANRAAWGCTSRNGGQGQNASGRLYRSQWIERWGKETALKLDAEIRAGYETFKSLVTEVPCDAQPGGHFYVAHREKKMDFLRNEAKVMRDVFGYETRMLSAEELRSDYFDEAEACGACPRGQGASRQPGAGGRDAQRRALPEDARRHGARPGRGLRHRRLHQQRPASEPGLQDLSLIHI